MKMKLVEKGFKAGTGRLSTLLNDVVIASGNGDNVYILSTEHIADNIMNIAKEKKIIFPNSNIKMFLGIPNIQDMVQQLIISFGYIPKDINMNFFIYGDSSTIDFNMYHGIDNIVFNKYIQLSNK